MCPLHSPIRVEMIFPKVREYVGSRRHSIRRGVINFAASNNAELMKHFAKVSEPRCRLNNAQTDRSMSLMDLEVKLGGCVKLRISAEPPLHAPLRYILGTYAYIDYTH